MSNYMMRGIPRSAISALRRSITPTPWAHSHARVVLATSNPTRRQDARNRTTISEAIAPKDDTVQEGHVEGNVQAHERRLIDRVRLQGFGITSGRISLMFPNATNPTKLRLDWLRDHCHCDKCVNQDTLQRSFNLFEHKPPTIESVELTEDGFHITWRDSPRTSEPREESESGIASLLPCQDPSLHESFYSFEWVSNNLSKKLPTHLNSRYRSWNKQGIETRDPREFTLKYTSIMDDDGGVKALTDNILVTGFCFVDDVPLEPEETKKLLERIAFIRETHYGGFYDFTADLNMKDTAYTNLELPAHTDTTYFTDPARLQAFHMLSHTDGDGGETPLVDGNYIASQLWKESKENFFYLAKTRVPWHASGNEGINITPMKGYPVLSLEEPLEETAEFSKWLDLVRHKQPEVFQIRWNNDDRATMPMTDGYEKWVIAARHWNDILTRAENRFWTKLTPGRVLIFDNWRVFHGRSAFTGKRRMCGGYINNDDFVSRWKNTHNSREEILKQLI